MAHITFRLKEPQIKKNPNKELTKVEQWKNTIPLSKQKETLIYLFFSNGYFERTETGGKKYINLKYSTNLKIKPYYWNGERVRELKDVSYQILNRRLDKIEEIVKDIANENPNAKPSRIRELLDKIIKGDRGEILNLNQYITRYTDEIKSGQRLTAKGEKFKFGTWKAFNGFKNLFDQFQKDRKKKLDFEHINIDFYNEFLNYLTSKNYSINTIGRHIKHLKTIVRAAREDGHHKNFDVDRKAFKVLTKNVDSIYLDESELRKMFDLDLKATRHLDNVRDIFLVGCYTAQRYSDYGRINKSNIKGKFIELVQQKTQEKVIIPIRPELLHILKKHNYKLPKTYQQKVNLYIKDVAKMAGIKETIQTEATKGGLILKTAVKKYDLVKTHTARRSGATNMYLAGIQTIDIMKITGHKTEREFLKYIKVSKEETAKTLSKHPYFNTPIMKVI